MLDRFVFFQLLFIFTQIITELLSLQVSDVGNERGVVSHRCVCVCVLTFSRLSTDWMFCAWQGDINRYFGLFYIGTQDTFSYSIAASFLVRLSNEV